MVSANDVIHIFDRESKDLTTALELHPTLGVVFRDMFTLSQEDSVALKACYLRWLKITADYVTHTIPMLRQAGLSLKSSGDDAEDASWSDHFLKYANEETDGSEGHQRWAHNDMRALGALESDIITPEPFSVLMYRKYFVDDAPLHPYGILGAKGVLEHLSITMATRMEKGLQRTGIPGIEHAVYFLHGHGELDIDHVKQGDDRLRTISSPDKLEQVALGAYVAAGSYRSFLDAI